MLLFWTLITGIIGGLLSHKTRPALDSVFESDGMQRIGAYSIGSIMLLVFLIPTFQHLAEIKNPAKRLAVAYLLTSASVGSGVVLAYIIDALDSQSRAPALET